MLAVDGFALEIDRAISSKDEAWRVDVLRRLADMFLTTESSLTDEARVPVDLALLVLSRSIEVEARAALSARASEFATPLPRLVKELALDPEISVAAPILSRSTHVDEETLVEIARNGSSAHIVAMAGGRQVTEQISDILLSRDDRDADRTLAANEAARLSVQGFDVLTDRAHSDADLLSAVAERPDLPSGNLKALFDVAKLTVTETLAGDLKSQSGAVMSELINSNSFFDQCADRYGLMMKALEASESFVRARAGNGRIDEATLLHWIRRGQDTDVIAGLAHLSGTSALIAFSAYAAQGLYPMLLICKAAELSWDGFKAVQEHRNRVPPDADTLAGAHAAFAALSVRSAKRVMRFVLMRARLYQQRARGAAAVDDTCGDVLYSPA